MAPASRRKHQIIPIGYTLGSPKIFYSNGATNTVICSKYLQCLLSAEEPNSSCAPFLTTGLIVIASYMCNSSSNMLVTFPAHFLYHVFLLPTSGSFFSPFISFSFCPFPLPPPRTFVLASASPSSVANLTKNNACLILESLLDTM